MCIRPKDHQLWTARSGRARIALAALLAVLLPNVLIEPAAAAKRIQSAVALTPEAIENARWSRNFTASKLSPVVFKAQVWLDRAGFSPGEIDAHGGENFGKALRAYQQANGLELTGRLNEQTWNALVNSSTDPTIRNYTIAQGRRGTFRRANSEAVLRSRPCRGGSAPSGLTATSSVSPLRKTRFSY